MRSEKCGECGDEFVWDSDAGSAVCIGCGTLQDPSQVVLDAHIDPADDGRDRYGLPFHTRSTLKAFRNSSGWDLTGQGKQASAERNKIAMRQYTVALASRIGHPALSTRSLYLFELAMDKGRFRYGRKARLVAGASLAIALREEQKGETIRDIAYLLDEIPVALARVFTSVIALLDMKLTSVDPSWHTPVLQRWLVELLAEQPPSLPKNLLQVLKTIHSPSALRTASSLSELVSRAGFLANATSPPTACAIYILALEGEGEVLSSLPRCGELAKALGRRFGVSKEVVMRRYKAIYEQVEGWAASVPWLAESRSSDGKKGSTRVAKRVTVARCLKDVVQFREKAWRSKLEASEPASVPDDGVESVSSSEINSSSEVDLQRNDEARPRKRRKTRCIDDVSRFLLAPSQAGSSHKSHTHLDTIPLLDVASHLLTSDSPSLDKPPTRLQLLSAEKSVEEITDDELFGEGEFESFLRSEEERSVLLQTCEWAQGSDHGRTDNGEPCNAHLGAREHSRTSRVNVEVLNRFLNDPEASAWIEAMCEDEDGANSSALVSNAFTGQIATDDGPAQLDGDKDLYKIDDDLFADSGEVIGPWRPLSPTNG
ncbi:hypothetical protein M0805_003021 [Coniferiporia weirii]|nr:hypothetical protein M0805_003021 [Coniferiporia weirii]